jgi:predicted nuclease of predicted toxin-antitoxin system
LEGDTILVTKDEDFVVRSTRETRAPVIPWLRVGNSTNAALRAWIEARMPGIVQTLGLGSRVVEVI